MKVLLIVAPVFLIGALVARAGAAEYKVARTTADRATLLGGDEQVWRPAAAISWGPSVYDTRFRALWAEDGLYLRFDATDPDPWHTMMKKDEHLWDEEVVEIFLDLDRSGRQYYELEINPAGVVCDLRMISPWPNKEGDIDWSLEGLLARVRPLEDAAGKTTGWTATAFLPWTGFSSLPSAQAIALPPRPGDAWRFNVFRIKRPGGPKEPMTNAVFAAWSPPPGPSFHAPEAFRDFVFEAAE